MITLNYTHRWTDNFNDFEGEEYFIDNVVTLQYQLLGTNKSFLTTYLERLIKRYDIEIYLSNN